MAQVKYTNYDVMKQKLKRSSKLYECLKPYASLSTLLFDTFLKNNGYLSSKDYYGSKFEIRGKTYSDWIHELKEARVVVQYKTEGNKGADFIRFAAGPLVVEYINAEKGKTKEIAAVDDVPSKAEFEELKARMGRVEEAVQELQEASAPTDTEEKKNRRQVATDRLSKFALAKPN